MYYNQCRCHRWLRGATPPLLLHQGRTWQKPGRWLKTLVRPIRLRHFCEQRITIYELAA